MRYKAYAIAVACLMALSSAGTSHSLEPALPMPDSPHHKHAPMSPETWRIGPLDIEIVSERDIEFPMFGIVQIQEHKYSPNVHRFFLEAQKGEDYGIKIKNNTGKRVGVVISVDGRNVISGKKSTLMHTEKMYIVKPFSTTVIEGWRTGGNTINRFIFTDEGASYAAAWGDYSAMGIIAIAAYSEKETPDHIQQKEGRREYVDSPRSAEKSDTQAGTGYGDEKYSPSVKVKFEPERRFTAKYIIKYEWRESLCKKGIMDCAVRGNKVMEEEEFAPPPPKKR